jgi:putative Ca2+/H+ antiporter (TMEM165/GDT1 family)
MKSYVAVFVSVLLSELGDKTQLATLIFATNPGISRIGVFLAAAAALVISSAAAVVVGAQLGDWLPTKALKVVAGLAFIAIGAWVIWSR